MPKSVSSIKDTPLSNVEVLQAVEVVKSTPSPVIAPTIANVTDCGSDPYMAQIYQHESGCSTTRTNSIGCLGLGQSCPASKLLAVCPTMDWACENAWFTNYANNRYGSPAQAWAVWQVQRWW